MDDYISRQALCQYALNQKDKSVTPNDIMRFPSADVVPVFHSEWERHMSFGICRNCGYEYDWKATDARNYCPNCGAKTDGGKS